MLLEDPDDPDLATESSSAPESVRGLTPFGVEEDAASS